jgi:hypothetical protein
LGQDDERGMVSRDKHGAVILFIPGHVFTGSEPGFKLQPGDAHLKTGCLVGVAGSTRCGVNCKKDPFALPCANNCRQVL